MEDALEDIGQVIDTIENLEAAASMPLPASLHLEALRESLPDLKERLRTAYFRLGGEDVWDSKS